MDKFQTSDFKDIYVPVELQYLDQLVRFRMNKYFEEQSELQEPQMPDIDQWQLPLSSFIIKNNLNKQEVTLLLIAITPHIQPDLFDTAIESKLKGSGDFPKLGGTRGKNFRGFLPTGETALFLLDGDDWNKRLEIQQLFWADQFFGKKKILWLEELSQGEPAMSGKIIMSQDYIESFTYGKPVAPHFSMNFPARLVHTDLTWDDLVISNELREQINELQSWVNFNDELMFNWEMQSRLRKGYRALFYGPPGTGKTFTAGLLGKYTNKDVYKVDLSMVVSKYIGETEKNLELLFARAEDKGWILFFDEADALFGKRTNVRDAHDKYANQEVSYLLQRIEDYNGLIILATNMKNNIDDAFIRRFNAILKFTFPDPQERSLIWQKSFPKNARFFYKPVSPLNDINIEKLKVMEVAEMLKKYELTGGSIINVAHYASLKAVDRRNIEQPAIEAIAAYDVECMVKQNGRNYTEIEPEEAEPKLKIYLSDIQNGIKRELIKEGKPFIF